MSDNFTRVRALLSDRTQTRLKELGVTACELLLSNPDKGSKELVSLMQGSATWLGFVLILFAEARSALFVRKIAQDLLYREVREEFPNGWFTDDDCHALVKLGSWECVIGQALPAHKVEATAILSDLTIDDVPANGWKPTCANDARLVELFDKYWSSE